MKHPTLIVATVAALGLAASAAPAAVVAGYAFTGNSLAPTTVDANADATSISGSPTVNNQPTSVVTTATNVGYATQPVLVASRASSTEATVPANVYFTFTVTADDGSELDLDSLTFDVARGGGATPRTYDVYTSVDNFATSLTGGPVVVGTQRPTFTAASVDLSGAAYQDLDAITFRVRVYAPDPGQSVDFDNVNLNGDVSAVAVPEPAGVGAAGAASLMLLRRRR